MSNLPVMEQLYIFMNITTFLPALWRTQLRGLDTSTHQLFAEFLATRKGMKGTCIWISSSCIIKKEKRKRKKWKKNCTQVKI